MRVSSTGSARIWLRLPSIFRWNLKIALKPLQTKYKINLKPKRALALIKLKLLGCQLFGYAWKIIFDEITSQILSELFVKCSFCLQSIFSAIIGQMYSINHNPANRKIFNKFSREFLIEATQWEKNKTFFFQWNIFIEQQKLFQSSPKLVGICYANRLLFEHLFLFEEIFLQKKSVYFSVMRWNIAIIYLFRLNKQNHPSSNTHRAQPQHPTNKYTIAMRITTNVARMEKNLQFHYANSKVVNKIKNNG